MAAGRLTISSITADAAPRNIDRPRLNQRPLYENALNAAGNNAERLLETLRRSGASEKLLKAMEGLLKTARAAGVEGQVMRILHVYAKDVKNDIVNLMLKRMDNLIKATDGALLAQRLDQCAELMKEFQGAADAVPALLASMQGDLGGSFTRLRLSDIRELISKSLSETENGPCPHSVHRTMRRKIRKGEFNHISVIAHVRDRIPDENGKTGNEKGQAEPAAHSQEPAVRAVLKADATLHADARHEAPEMRELRIVYLPISEVWTDQPKRAIGGDDDSLVQKQVEAARTVNAERTERIAIPRLVWNGAAVQETESGAGQPQKLQIKPEKTKPRQAGKNEVPKTPREKTADTAPAPAAWMKPPRKKIVTDDTPAHPMARQPLKIERKPEMSPAQTRAEKKPLPAAAKPGRKAKPKAIAAGKQRSKTQKPPRAKAKERPLKAEDKRTKKRKDAKGERRRPKAKTQKIESHGERKKTAARKDKKPESKKADAKPVEKAGQKPRDKEKRPVKDGKICAKKEKPTKAREKKEVKRAERAAVVQLPSREKPKRKKRPALAA